MARDYGAIFSKLNLRVFIANYTRRRRCQRLRDCVTCTVRVSVTVRVHVSVRGCNTASTLRHAMSSSDHRIVGLSIGLPQIVRSVDMNKNPHVNTCECVSINNYGGVHRNGLCMSSVDNCYG